mmetsp:Transcript_2636/g.8119  ORF Transcript_2636/g.8119 Transcript_2636/m.8119 type:complete len:262 (-) Transcript_2636:997-1782(-)
MARIKLATSSGGVTFATDSPIASPTNCVCTSKLSNCFSNFSIVIVAFSMSFRFSDASNSFTTVCMASFTTFIFACVSSLDTTPSSRLASWSRFNCSCFFRIASVAYIFAPATLPLLMAFLHFVFKFDSSFAHFCADRCNDFAVNFKFTICSNKRFSARRAGFRKSKRPIFVDDRSTDALLFYLASGKSAFFNNDAIFWVPFLQVHFYTRLERRERANRIQIQGLPTYYRVRMPSSSSKTRTGVWDCLVSPSLCSSPFGCVK